jgi:cysteinyl-tRNA synthetase
MLRVYNTLTRNFDEFITREKGKVYMYVCGVTPYDYPHIGHGRAAVVYDVMHRYLEYKGYEMFHISNFTDIDDKIIKRSNELGVYYKDLAEKYAVIYLENIDALNVKRLWKYPRATEEIPAIIDMVKTLQDKGFAYEISDGVYYEVRKFKEYGKLSHRSLEELRKGARIEVNPEKKDPLDFALWKKAKKGEPSWDSPWGKGRPGWHIECSAMSLKYLGNGFDIHGGGEDLIFPHHENEIAQSEAYTGKKPFVRYWLHNGMITVNKEKMSKSLKNFFTMSELLKKYDGEVIRLYLITISYHKPLNFDMESLEQARKSYEYFNESYIKLKEAIESGKKGTDIEDGRISSWRSFFEEAMDNDFNTANVFALLFEIFKFTNANSLTLSSAAAKKIDSLLKDIFSVLGFAKLGVRRETINLSFKNDLLKVIDKLKENDKLVPFLSEINTEGDATDILEEIIKIRFNFRKEKQFDISDIIRDELKNAGVVLEDSREGTKYKLVMTDERD